MGKSAFWLLALGLYLLGPNSVASKFSSKLFVLDEAIAGTCNAKLIVIPSKSETVLFNSKPCPANIIIDPTKNAVFYTAGGQMWKRSYHLASSASGSKPEALGKLPGPELKDDVISNVVLWLDSGTGRPMYAYMVETHAIDTKGLPDWGIPYMAHLAEFADGKWVEIEARPTKADADGTPGFSMLTSFNKRQIRGLDIESLQPSSTCAGGIFKCDSQNTAAKNVLPASETYGEIQTEQGGVFAFPTSFGDSLHAMSPVVFAPSKMSQWSHLKEWPGVKPLRNFAKQLSLSVAGPFLLVGIEYSNARAIVYDGRTGEVIYKALNSRRAAWLPN